MGGRLLPLSHLGRPQQGARHRDIRYTVCTVCILARQGHVMPDAVKLSVFWWVQCPCQSLVLADIRCQNARGIQSNAGKYLFRVVEVLNFHTN